MEELNLFSKERQTELYELIHEMNHLRRALVDGCFNKNGKSNKDSISFSQFQMLQLINYMDDGCILKDIAEKHCMSKGALSIMLSKLELMNLIEKYTKQGQTDKRSVNIRLTEKGKNILKEKEHELSSIIENQIALSLDENDKDFIENVVSNTLRVLRKVAKQGELKNE
ncbi:MAG: winged helix DNA-binding protein [archaeon]|nr:winged helix DNA-binding protein [archaeon]